MKDYSETRYLAFRVVVVDIVDKNADTEIDLILFGSVKDGKGFMNKGTTLFILTIPFSWKRSIQIC